MPKSESQRVEAYDTEQPFLERVQEAVERTRTNPDRDPRVEFNADGSYSIDAERLRDSADTIGTKADLHWQARTFGAAAQDAFAMNYNDLIRDRYRPVMLTNVIMIERQDDDAIVELAEGLERLSFERGIQMGDGETAILDTMPGFELSVTMTGVPIDNAENRYQPGDVLIGFPSYGLHSNGYSDARRLFGPLIHHDWMPRLLEPTRIYDEVPSLLERHKVHGLTHVTGGGLTKTRTEGLDLHFTRTHLSAQHAEILHELFDRWLDENDPERLTDGATAWVDDRMHRKFNSGIGFVLGCPPEAVDGILQEVPETYPVGHVTEGSGLVVVTESAYTGRALTL